MNDKLLRLLRTLIKRVCGGVRRRRDYQTGTAAHMKTLPGFDGETEDATDAAVTRCIRFSSRPNCGIKPPQPHTCTSHVHSGNANRALSTGAPLFIKTDKKRGRRRRRRGCGDRVVGCVRRRMLPRRGGRVWESSLT